MTIMDTYSSWCRNLLDRKDRELIAAAGPGGVYFSRPNGRWCARIEADGRSSIGFGRLPGDAFTAALLAHQGVPS